MKQPRMLKIVNRKVIAETLQGNDKTLHLECGHNVHAMELGTGIKADQTVCHACTRSAN